MNLETTILANLADSPAFFSPGKEGHVLACLNQVAALDDFESMMLARTVAGEDFWDQDEWFARYRPYNVSAEGVLSIPVSGVLLHRFPYQVGRYATGYAYVRAAVERGLQDDAVRSILLVCDTPGGEVAGCFETSDLIYEANERKPVTAIAADAAYSAGYALASAAGEVWVTRSGGTGSVGVVTAHVSYEDALKKMGIEITFIFAGAHKVDGNPYEKLPTAVKDRIQARIDRIYGQFVALVARNRGMEDEAVRATEALTYDAQESVEVNFADAVGEIEDVMAAMTAATQTEWKMARNQTQAPEASDSPATVEASVHEAAVASARAEGMTEGANAERARLSTILTSDAAKTRPASATKLAFNPKLASLSATDVVEMLADLPEEKAEAPSEPAPKAGTTPFEATMDKDGTPGVGASTGDDEGDATGSQTNAILSAFGKATGRKPNPKH